MKEKHLKDIIYIKYVPNYHDIEAYSFIKITTRNLSR